MYFLIDFRERIDLLRITLHHIIIQITLIHFLKKNSRRYVTYMMINKSESERLELSNFSESAIARVLKDD